MSRSIAFLLLFLSIPLLGQQPSVPEIPYQSVPDFFKLPPRMYMGEASGVALNSRGHIFIYNRGEHPLMEFDNNGNFLQTIGDGLYGFLEAHSVRVDAEDNIWAVDVGSNMVIKFSPDGRVLMTIGRRTEFISLRPPGTPPPPPNPNNPNLVNETFDKPTDVAFGPSGDIFISDGYGNSRVVKFDKDGNWVKTWGKKGSEPGEFNLPHALVVDAKGLLYVADKNNKRIQIFDSEGNFLKEWRFSLGPSALCITGDPKHQIIYMTDSSVQRALKLDLEGNILGAFGKRGRALGQFGNMHGIACGATNEVYVADTSGWRVQKLILQPTH
jgi:DNA-binding beta-propeller fold protein YncE